MFTSPLLLSRYLALLILALVIASGTYVLAAANKVNGSGAGEGANTITPYIVDSNTIRYTLDDQINPTDIKKVQFKVNIQAGSSANPPGKIYAQIDSGSWVNCSNSGGDLWECVFNSPYPKVRVSPLPTLHVVAAQ